MVSRKARQTLCWCSMFTLLSACTSTVLTPSNEEIDLLVEQKLVLEKQRELQAQREQELTERAEELEQLRLAMEQSDDDAVRDLETKLQEEKTRRKQLEKKITQLEEQLAQNEVFEEDRATGLDDLILGEVEHAWVQPPGMRFEARIDSGAQTSSINALDITEFERDGEPYITFYLLHPESGERVKLTRRKLGSVRIKELGSTKSTVRPVVRLRTVIGEIDERVRYTLVDRTGFNYQVLIGRNFLRDLAIIDPSRRFTTEPVIEDE